MSRLDIGNFMGVIGATAQDTDGIRFSGEHMPSGKDVVAKGVTLAELMSNREMAETWYETIKVTHEQEQKQADHDSSTADTPDLVVRGQDGDAQDTRGTEAPAEVCVSTFEEELQERYTHWNDVVSDLYPRLRDAEAELLKVATAMGALDIEPYA